MAMLNFLSRMTSHPIKLLHREFRRSPEARYIHRLHGVLLVTGGLSAIQAGKLLRVSQRTVAHWVKRFGEQGLDGLWEAPKSGRPATISSAVLRSLHRALAKPPQRAGLAADTWTGLLVSQFLRRRHGVQLTMRHGRRLLRAYEREQAARAR
jgi:transposase